MKLFNTVCLILALNLPSLALANPAFSVAPDRSYIDLNQPQTYVFMVKNTGDQLIHVRITPAFLPVESNALAAGKSLVSAKQQEATSLVPYTLISPQVLSLQPTEQRDVRVSIRVPDDLKPGTYREHLTVKMLEVARQINSAGNNSDVGIHLNLLMQIAPVIYGDKGSNEAMLSLRCQLNKDHQLTLEATNKTPWHFSGILTGYGSDNTKPLFTQTITVFRNSERTVETNWKATTKTINLEWRNDHNPDAPVQKTPCNLK